MGWFGDKLAKAHVRGTLDTLDTLGTLGTLDGFCVHIHAYSNHRNIVGFVPGRE